MGPLIAGWFPKLLWELADFERPGVAREQSLGAGVIGVANGLRPVFDDRIVRAASQLGEVHVRTGRENELSEIRIARDLILRNRVVIDRQLSGVLRPQVDFDR